MRRKRKLFGHKSKPKESGQLALQITSMADIFTILLVFLLKGLASDALTISPSNGTTLPSGFNTTSIADSALQVELSDKGIMIEKELISGYEKFEGPLGEQLAKARERQKLIAKSNDTVKDDSRVILLSDQKVKFSTMKRILQTLSQYGYNEVKFGVIKE